MVIKISEGYETGKTADMRYRFWKVLFEREAEATTFFCDDRADVLEKWDDPDDDCVIFVAKKISDTWDQAKGKLLAVLKEAFGPTAIEFIEKKWESASGQKVIITTVGQGYILRAKFRKNILPEQTVALEEELAPEGDIINGIEDAKFNLTGFRCVAEVGKKAVDLVPIVIIALRKVLGQDVKVVHQQKHW